MPKNHIENLDSTGPLVNIPWLSERITEPNIKVLDCSWYLPNQKRDPKKEFLNSHIPGARFFDIELISDQSSNFPHMLPNHQDFASAVGKLGISNDDFIVVYDCAGVFSSPRVWWMFRVFGHNRISVLQGGLPKWKLDKKKLESGQPSITPKKFLATFNHELVRNQNNVLENIESSHEQLVDARSIGRFCGKEPEPRQGLRSGHVPGSINLPYTNFLDQKGIELLDPNQIRKITKDAGIELNLPIISTCGSGISAALLTLAFYTAGHTSSSIYDGSWTEWASSETNPVATES